MVAEPSGGGLAFLAVLFPDAVVERGGGERPKAAASR
jgi:hypothetical protein